MNDLPKPMVSVAGKPLLEHQLLLLKRYGINDVIMLTGYLSEKIENYFGNGSQWGMQVRYCREDIPLGTSGALKQLEAILKERFLVLYGDVVMDFDIKRFQDFDAAAPSLGSLIVHPNDHPYDSDLVERKGDIITRFISKPHPDGLIYENLVNAAVYILSPEIFKFIDSSIASDFGKDIFPLILKQGGRLRAYSTPEYIKDLGTPDRLHKVEKDYTSGKVENWNRSNKRPAIFLDRDGVLNEEVDNLRRIEDFKMLPGVAEAIRLINQSEYLAIVITNQPGIAKGFLSFEKLKEVHNLLETTLGREKAFLNQVYFCPHHADKGFDGEIAELKVSCECRKPAIGMILQAEKEYNIDLSRSFFIGDTTTDIKTALNAGLTSILVETGYGGNDNRYRVIPDFVASNLGQAVDWILTKNKTAQ
ncbi:HAD-IIIA family hydrolase [Dyadobacter sp. CY345]|nr:HAD-IIIA family hydrolase [Dyadobacter sp. CY345]